MIDMEFSSSCTPRLLVLAISVGSVVRTQDGIHFHQYDWAWVQPGLGLEGDWQDHNLGTSLVLWIASTIIADRAFWVFRTRRVSLQNTLIGNMDQCNQALCPEWLFVCLVSPSLHTHFAFVHLCVVALFLSKQWSGMSSASLMLCHAYHVITFLSVLMRHAWLRSARSDSKCVSLQARQGPT